MKKYNKIIFIITSIVIIFAAMAYLFKINFSEREEYGRYSVKYYILAPSSIKSLATIIDSQFEQFISITSDGPSPAITIAIFRGVENPDSMVGKCVEMLKSHSVTVIPSNTPVMEEPDVNLFAKIDVSRISTTHGDITVTLIDQGP